MKPTTLFVFALITCVCSDQFPRTNSESLFGEYKLSAALDARACPKKLVIKDLRPYVSIREIFPLPVSHLVFDGVQCTKGNQKLNILFTGTDEGYTESRINGTCLKRSVSIHVFTPLKYSNGTFSFGDPSKPLVTSFEFNVNCTHCRYSKPFFGVVKEGYDPDLNDFCAGSNVYPPIFGFGERLPKEQPKYFINTRCEMDDRAVIRGGVVYRQRSLVEDKAVIEIRVQGIGRSYSMKSTAHCASVDAPDCIDWRRWPEELVLPKRGSTDVVSITVFVNDRAVKVRTFYEPNGCDRKRGVSDLKPGVWRNRK